MPALLADVALSQQNIYVLIPIQIIYRLFNVFLTRHNFETLQNFHHYFILYYFRIDSKFQCILCFQLKTSINISLYFNLKHPPLSCSKLEHSKTKDVIKAKRCFLLMDVNPFSNYLWVAIGGLGRLVLFRVENPMTRSYTDYIVSK